MSGFDVALMVAIDAASALALFGALAFLSGARRRAKPDTARQAILKQLRRRGEESPTDADVEYFAHRSLDRLQSSRFFRNFRVVTAVVAVLVAGWTALDVYALATGSVTPNT
jgi:hypothetical protein